MGSSVILFSDTSSFLSELKLPRLLVNATSAFLWRLYLAFTLAEVAVLSLLGMGLFDAVNHSFTTMATGGFSTYDDSIGAFDSPAIELAISFFMLAGGVNFGLYFLVLRGGGFAKALKNLELRVYLGLVVVVTMFMAISTLPMRDGAWLVSLQKSLFKVISVLTSTGYSVESDVLYGQPVVLALVMLMFIGGSSGSTSGGLKVSRIMIVVETAWITVRQHVRPNVVEVVKLDGQVVDERKVREVSTVLFVHGASLLIGAFVIALIEGTSGPTSLGAMLTCLSNMGPAPFHVGADNFASYGPLAHLIFGFAMILGRLEFLTVMVLLLPEMWRR